MPLDTPDRESIATLLGQRPYLLLLQELEESVHDILAEMLTARTDEEALKTARLWQVFFRYLSILKTKPESIRMELNREIEDFKKASSYLPTDPVLAPPFSQARAEMLERIESIANSNIPSGRNYDFS